MTWMTPTQMAKGKTKEPLVPRRTSCFVLMIRYAGHSMASFLGLCLESQVARVKNKWKCVLKDGMIHVNGKDYLFAKCNGYVCRAIESYANDLQHCHREFEW